MWDFFVLPSLGNTIGPKFVHFSSSTFLSPYFHHLICYLGQIYIKFGANFATKFLIKYAERALSNGAIWYKFSEQPKHQRKHHI